MTDPKMTPENLGRDIARRTEARAREIGEDEIVKLGRKLEKLGGSVQRKTTRRAPHPH